MCWQDVRITNAQTIASYTSAQSGAGYSTTYGPNKRRRRFIISSPSLTTNLNQPNQLLVFASSASNDYAHLIVQTYVYSPVIIDVADYGTAVQGNITIIPDETLAGNPWVIIEVELNDPYDLGSPRGQPE
jgi:hypothetical protein